MPKNKEEINTSEAPDDATDAKAVQKWSVWTQGPKDAKETKRKFNQTTPGQERDYKKLVGKRKFQRFEAVEQEDEDAAVNSVAGGGVDMAPNASGTKVWMKRRRLEVDGRSKAYRAATKRIKERNAKANERDTVKKLSQFGVINNPFAEEKNMDDNKYLKTKEGSIEQAALDSVEQKPYNPNDDQPTLTLPKNRYLDTKEESIEWSVMKALSENGDHPPKGPHKHKLPRQLKDPKKEKMVGTKSGTKVVDRGDPKYKNAPEHESVEVPEASGEIKAKKLRLKRRYKTWDKASKGEPEKGEEGGEKGDVEAGPKEKEKSTVTKSDLDRVSPKELKGRFKDRKDKDLDNNGKVNKLDRFLHKRRKAISKDKANQDGDPVGYGGKVKEETEIDELQVANRGSAKRSGTRIPGVSDPSPERPEKRAERLNKQKARARKKYIEAEPKEEVEMDELSKKTLGSYTSKAAIDVMDRAGKPEPQYGHSKNRKKMVKRTQGIVRAADKLSKEELESVSIDDLANHDHHDYDFDIRADMVSYVQELSKKTLGSYVKKASQERGSAGVALGQTSASGKQTQADVKQHAGKMIKRQKGLDKAVDKLSKESKEVEAGERDVGSDEYANYVKTLTPGEKAETDVHNRDARKAEVKQKKEKVVQNHQATRIDDEYNLDEVRPGMFGSNPGQGSKSSIQKPKPKPKPVVTTAPKKEEVEIDEGGAYGGGLKDAAKNLKKAEKRLGITPDKTTTTTTKGGGILRKTTYKGKIDMGQKKEDKDKPEQGKVYALTGKSSEPSIARGDSWKKSVMKKPASGVKKHEWKPKKEDVNTSMVDAVKEVLGHAGWAGLGNMPPTDPKTGKYVTGKTKIKRLPYDKNNPSKKPEKK